MQKSNTASKKDLIGFLGHSCFFLCWKQVLVQKENVTSRGYHLHNARYNTPT